MARFPVRWLVKSWFPTGARIRAGLDRHWAEAVVPGVRASLFRSRIGLLQGLTALLLILGTTGEVCGQFWTWRSWTSSKDVRDIAVGSDRIWAATSGGLVGVDPTSLEIVKYTNSEGLSANDLRAVAVDSSGRVWIGLGNGFLNVFDPASGRIEEITDYSGREIYDLAVKGDSLYVGLSLGVSLYLIERREVKETYRNLGEAFPLEIAAKSIVIRNDTIWVGTDYGLAYADLRFPNLQAPDFWHNITASDGLPSDEVRGTGWWDGRLYLATAKGLAAWNGTAWDTVRFREEEVVDLVESEQGLVAASLWAVERFDGNRWRRLGGTLRRVQCLTVDRQGRIWAGTGEEGLLYYEEDRNQWVPTTPDEPAGNNIKDMKFDHNGVLWVATLYSGVFSFDGKHWEHYSVRTGHLPIDNVLAVAVDEKNRKWFGTQGRGVVVFTETDTGIAITRYSSEDGKLAGSDTPYYVIIEDVEVDAFGNVWILNKFANNGRAVAVVTPDDQWVYFSTLDGIRSTRVTSIAFDLLGRAWVGTETEGVSVIDYGQTLLDPSDDDLSQGLSKAVDGLESDLVRSIAVDPSGVVWIGTDQGLNFWFEGQVGVRYGLISEDIYRVSVDPQGNKWIGTAGGVTILDPDGYPERHFTTDNSPLVWEHVQAFAFQEETGDVFIGTTNGISQVTTPYTAPKPDLKEVDVYPNPFRPGEAGAKLAITNLARQSKVRIYTADGLLVRNFLPSEVPGGRVLWDGRNDRGEMVSSGIYLVLVTTEDGQSAVRKVAIVR